MPVLTLETEFFGNFMENKRIKASDCKCIECGKQAEVFWPCIDIDIPSNPYCRKCVTKQQIMALEGLETFNKTKKK